MDIMIIVYAVLAYLIGSIPSGLIIGKTFFNTDVRQYGSKNIGATNNVSRYRSKSCITSISL